MCGIAGIAYSDHQFVVDKTMLARMCDAIVHRGPDGRGMHCQQNVGLGMQRLSIIDLATGNQPIFNEDGSIWVVFNGELYNFQPLRQQLAALGHVFTTQSDTEVIVHAYEQYGLDCIPLFNGMFAFALWDEHHQRLILARDRSGQKPLFYHQTAERFVFASEIKALLRVPQIARSIHLPSLYHYLSLQYVPGPRTIFEDILQLPPAHYAVWHDGHLTIQPYWTVAYEPQQQISDEEWQRQVRRAVWQAVERHMISDVPLGAFLSGGVDSSIIVGVMSQISKQPVKTFSIGFDIHEYDETQHARRVAERFNTEHKELILSTRDIISVIHDVVCAVDQPFADTSALAVYCLARFTRQHVTVALSGDGGDEAFAGYLRYLLDPWLSIYRRFPLRNIVTPLVKRLKVNSRIPTDHNVVAGLQRLEQAAATSAKASIMAWGSYFGEAHKHWLGTGDWLAAVGAHNTEHLLATSYDDAQATTPLTHTLATDFVTYLPDDLLVKADRMSMAHSLEVRAPFLDNEVLALTAAIPDHHKITGFTQKAILRRAFADLLPPENVNRIKRGFGIPVSAWMLTALRGMVQEVLLDGRLGQRGYFQRTRIQQLYDEHQARTHDHGQRLWALLMFELWCQQYLDE
jgi:asparagine synthase (glutamine-hydrolysing)